MIRKHVLARRSSGSWCDLNTHHFGAPALLQRSCTLSRMSAMACAVPAKSRGFSTQMRESQQPADPAWALCGSEPPAVGRPEAAREHTGHSDWARRVFLGAAPGLRKPTPALRKQHNSGCGGSVVRRCVFHKCSSGVSSVPLQAPAAREHCRSLAVIPLVDWLRLRCARTLRPDSKNCQLQKKRRTSRDC